MIRVVLDASAVLAMLNVEPGGDVVADFIGRARISSVNVIEVLTRLVDKGQSFADARRTFAMLQLDIEPVDADLAYAAAALRSLTKSKGLSLGDRVCIALAQRLSVPVLTSDTAWTDIKVGVDVRMIR